MWNSAFWQDGPGIANARLADEYGVIIGTSHHEPLCRSGVEWQRQYQNYGTDNTWSFITNHAAITEFWKDGILRSKDFENIVTIGMRGENDSFLMGQDATMQDNIEVLKKALATQNQLLKNHVNPDLAQIPRMFAIYKEVEDYYFGTADCEGLKTCRELEDVILLLSDDNYGNLRAIPDPAAPPRSGGYGIYYHFDYHGGPYSFEWLNFTNLAKTWEQMTMAYEYGIREMWIVNVGDIKGKEYPLSYFMSLAYDYGQWGISNLNSAAEYTEQWIDRQLGPALPEALKSQVHGLLDSYTMWSAARIPESLHPAVYKNNFHEIERTCQAVRFIHNQLEALRSTLPKSCLSAYESMIYFPAAAFFNTMLINLTAGMNQKKKKRGVLAANGFVVQLQELISRDKQYITAFDQFLDGKWEHMMDSAHMCFKNWDDYDWTYPDIRTVSPIPHAKIGVSFRGNEAFSLGHHWQEPPRVTNLEMTRPGVNAVILDIDSRGDIDFSFAISCDKDWLSFSPSKGSSQLAVDARTSVHAVCDRALLAGRETASIQIDFAFANGDRKQAFLNVVAGGDDFSRFSGAYLEAQDYICIPAAGYAAKTDVAEAGFRDVPRLGRAGSAIKSFPVTKNWTDQEESPSVRYDFIVSRNNYTVTFYFSPRNPLVKDGKISCRFRFNENPPQSANTIPADFYAGHFDKEWSLGVTNNIRKMAVDASFAPGLNHLYFYAADPNIILENIVIAPAEKPVPETHLAPPESCRMN
jgi:hypothetical protein